MPVFKSIMIDDEAFSTSDLTILARLCSFETVAPGKKLFQAGEKSTHAYVVLDGKLAALKDNESMRKINKQLKLAQQEAEAQEARERE